MSPGRTLWSAPALFIGGKLATKLIVAGVSAVMLTVAGVGCEVHRIRGAVRGTDVDNQFGLVAPSYIGDKGRIH